VYDCTSSIVFLGTPHRGSDYADWGVLAARIARASGFAANDSIIRSLNPQAEYLEFLREQFSKMLAAKAFDVDTFQEALGFKGVRGLSGKVWLIPYPTSLHTLLNW
jgi:hypothetical protein